MRELNPGGIHIGAFGIVEDLLPDSSQRPSQSLDSLGYVHAPSLQQATAVSILRSSFLANRQAAGNAFDIDLSSHRVKRAKRLLEGLANGQSMAALLGYRFERALRDKDLPQHILEFRRAFPLRPVGSNSGDEAKEEIAARDVVDGVRMMDAYRNNKAAFAVTGVPAALTHQGGAIGDVIDDLLDQMDSVSDLLISESVYQMVGGNMGGAGASMMTLDKQHGPLKPYTLGAAPSPSNTFSVIPARPPMPTAAHYSGMPADRYWEFEDGRVNFGMLGAAKSDLARLAVLEYALVFGNDWFVLPLTLPVNALYRVTTFTVLDNFGIELPIPPADGNIYEMGLTAGAPVERLANTLYLCPKLDTLEGPPLEHVLMMRDEMANLVWGIEKRVQGTSGEPIDRKFESTRLSTTQTLRPPLDAPSAASGGLLQYRLQTPVAANWVPFPPGSQGRGNTRQLGYPVAACCSDALLPGDRKPLERPAQCWLQRIHSPTSR